MKFWTNQFFPATGWVEYACVAFDGRLNGMQIQRTSDVRPVPPPNDSARYTFMRGVPSDAPTIPIVITPVGTFPPANWFETCDNLVVRSDTLDGKKGLIGESGAMVGKSSWCQQGARMNPLEAYLPLDVTDYTTPTDFTITTQLYRADGTQMAPVTWPGRFQNLGISAVPWWPQFPQVLLTAFYERPGPGGTMYNFYFSTVGMIQKSWIVINADGVTGTGYRVMMSNYSLT